MDSSPSESDRDAPLAIRFHCPPELKGRVPVPIPAAEGLPTWLREMPALSMNPLVDSDDDTVKRCPPFVDAMTYGFLIPLVCDVRCEGEELSWDLDLPPCGAMEFPRSPLGFHHPAQVTGTPLCDEDRFLIKFHSFWTIETPPGYSVLFMHPANRFDLPFTTLTGMVDCDSYHDLFVNIPARWSDPAFRGVLKRGTPIAQCIPVRRERLEAVLGARDETATSRSIRTLHRIAEHAASTGVSADAQPLKGRPGGAPARGWVAGTVAPVRQRTAQSPQGPRVWARRVQRREAGLLRPHVVPPRGGAWPRQCGTPRLSGGYGRSGQRVQRPRGGPGRRDLRAFGHPALENRRGGRGASV